MPRNVLQQDDTSLGLRINELCEILLKEKQYFDIGVLYITNNYKVYEIAKYTLLDEVKNNKKNSNDVN